MAFVPIVQQKARGKMSSDKFHCTNGHCLTDCVLSSIDYDKDIPPAFCPHSGGVVRWKKCETTEKKPTVFDRITSSPEGAGGRNGFLGTR